MIRIAYVDTSAFVKRFVQESRSDEMDAFAAEGSHRLAVSSLTVTEFRSVMKRRLRMHTVTREFLNTAVQQFLHEIAADALRFHAIEAATFNLAAELIDSLASPLATVDALHLASAKACGATLMVSADKQLIKASRESGLKVLDLAQA
jgi:predicted nucleic acid-binding protein